MKTAVGVSACSNGEGARARGRGLPSFTLVELLVSLSILAVIAALSFGSFQSINRIVDVNRRNERAQRSVRTLVDRLDAELAGAIFARSEAETLFLSRRQDIDGKNVNDLTFTTLMPQAYLEIGRRDEIVKVEYTVQRNEENEGLLVVKKRIYTFLLSPYPEREPEPGPETGVAEFVVRDDFTAFVMRFYKGGRWYDGWDSKQTILAPDGVELVFSLGDKTFREYFNVFI
jgi:prepilin-type N-terminal cleavage/methylation domain-containing protein